MARPRIKIDKEPIDNTLEIIAIISLIFLIIYPIINFGVLPDKFPTHFDSSGNPDAFGSKNSIWIIPAAGIFIYLLFHFIGKYPHAFNYGGVKITEENASIQYKTSLRMMRILKTIILAAFAYISFSSIQVALGNTFGIGKIFLPLFMILIFGSIGFGLYQTYKNQ